MNDPGLSALIKNEPPPLSLITTPTAFVLPSTATTVKGMPVGLVTPTKAPPDISRSAVVAKEGDAIGVTPKVPAVESTTVEVTPSTTTGAGVIGDEFTS